MVQRSDLLSNVIKTNNNRLLQNIYFVGLEVQLQKQRMKNNTILLVFCACNKKKKNTSAYLGDTNCFSAGESEVEGSVK